MDNEVDAIMNNLNDAIQGLSTLLDNKGAMCTSWILVSEWMDSNGDVWFSTHSEPDLPIWRKNGMLQHAIDSGSMQHYIDQGAPDEGSSS